MFRFTGTAAVCVSLAVLAVAQDKKKWEPPPTPDGWKAAVSSDGAYRFVVPRDTRRSGTRDRTTTAGGVKTRTQVNTYTLKDDTVLKVEVATLTGPGLNGVKVGDVIDLVLAAEKDDGFTVSDPKGVTVGDLKAREYRLAKGDVSRRMVLFAVKPRIFTLDVAATDPAKLDTETANTFLRSLVLVPPEVVRAAAREKARKDEEAGKEHLEKYGAKWTADLREMTPPDAPAVGLIRGREFKPDAVTLEPGGRLVLRQGKGVFADVEVDVFLFLKANESVENKSYSIPPAAVNPAGSPHLRLAVMPPNGKVPRAEPFVGNYALKLTFGAKDDAGTIPGTIYLCAPDATKSFLAGKFTLTVK